MKSRNIRSLDYYASPRVSTVARLPAPDRSPKALLRRFLVIGCLSLMAYFLLPWAGLPPRGAALVMACALVFAAMLVRPSQQGNSISKVGSWQKDKVYDSRSAPSSSNDYKKGDQIFTSSGLGTGASATVCSSDEAFDVLGEPGSMDFWEPLLLNPATGLPMIGGVGGVDACGNPYGCDSHSD